MLKKKSLISILLLICITLLAFSGCNNDPADNSSPDPSQPQESSETSEGPDLSNNYEIKCIDSVLYGF